ncbi:MAG TPA: flagellar biosynthesis regulator FlaF [Thermodesulfobacteriota bacterium]|nr:flagellar biosynthesis regulator FlaF [Thermodesulfobacteriota bacterium]
MYGKQLEVYRATDKATMSGREIEASVLTQAALKLKDCQENWDAEDRQDKLLEAFRFNQMIWSIFQGELVKVDHPLPKQIRQDILSLSVFIDKRIFDAMAYPSPEKLTAIININLNLAAGLRGSPGE